jgi:hypothetical protein
MKAAKSSKQTKGSKPAIISVRGVPLAKVNEKTLSEHLVTLGLRPQKQATLALKLELYLDWTADMLKKRDEAAEAAGNSAEDYGICDNCEAPCDPNAKTCPVCGKDHNEPAPAAAAPAAATKAGKAKASKTEKNTPAAPPTTEVQGNLDETVTRIKELVESSMHNHYKLGCELIQCFTSKLYKTRLGDDNKPKYKSWDQFCEAELPVGGRQAREIMAVAERYTEAQVVEFGVEKLQLIAKAPTAEQPKLIEEVREKNLSKRQLAEVVKGGGRRPAAGARDAALAQGREAAKAKRARQIQAENGEAVTVAFQLGEYELPLRPTANGFVAQQEQVNGVVSTYTIVTTGRRRYMRIVHARPKKKS